MTLDDMLSFDNLPETERPRERLFLYGAETLTPAELVALILRTGTSGENALQLARRILAQYGDLYGLAQTTTEELTQIKGLGKAKTAQLIASLEIARRLLSRQPGERTLIRSSNDAARLLMDMSTLTQEHVRAILLDTSQRVIAIPTIYIGTVNAAVLRVAEVFREAIKRNAAAIILAHNHPSGDTAPSPEDITITHTIFTAGKLLDIALIDHLIIGSQSWTSIKDLGLVFER